METPPPSYIAFIDLLGVKELARYEPSNYHKAMLDFQEALTREAGVFPAEDSKTPAAQRSRVYFFSDSAFVQSSDLPCLLKFVKNIRLRLLGKGFYFKAAIDEGELNALSHEEYIERNFDEYQQENIKKNSQFMIGNVFMGESISKVYRRHEEFKGIGINIAESIARKLTTGSTSTLGLCENFHLSRHTAATAKSYYDIHLSNAELDDSCLTFALTNKMRANIKSRKLGVYYLSLLSNFAISHDYTKLSATPNGRLGGDPYTTTFVDTLLTLHEDYKSLFQKSEGLELLYYKFIDKVYSDRKMNDDVTQIIVNKIMRMPRILANYTGKFETLPEFVFKYNNKELFIEDYSKILKDDMQKRRKEAEEKNKIQVASLTKSIAAIEKKLTDSRLPSLERDSCEIRKQRLEEKLNALEH